MKDNLEKSWLDIGVTNIFWSRSRHGHDEFGHDHGHGHDRKRSWPWPWVTEILSVVVNLYNIRVVLYFRKCDGLTESISQQLKKQTKRLSIFNWFVEKSQLWLVYLYQNLAVFRAFQLKVLKNSAEACKQTNRSTDTVKHFLPNHLTIFTVF